MFASSLQKAYRSSDKHTVTRLVCSNFFKMKKMINLSKKWKEWCVVKNRKKQKQKKQTKHIERVYIVGQILASIKQTISIELFNKPLV